MERKTEGNDNKWESPVIVFLKCEEALEAVCNFIHVVEVLDAEGRYKGL
jgi:hypothetical protein